LVRVERHPGRAPLATSQKTKRARRRRTPP
jgi:hypothetical protein